jgi:hypothetical protein
MKTDYFLGENIQLRLLLHSYFKWQVLYENLLFF